MRLGGGHQRRAHGYLIGLYNVESILVFLAFFQAVSLPAGIAFAQSVNGLISGTVVDQQHGSVPEAIVQITDELKTTSQTTQTDEKGYFTFSGLRPGKYTLSVEKNGFEKLEKRDILLLTADRLSVGTLTLKIGPGTEVVTVTSENPPVDTTSSEQSAVISAEEMTALPVIGNDYVSLTKTIPGSTYLGFQRSRSQASRSLAGQEGRFTSSWL